jgi:hypothetical protein
MEIKTRMIKEDYEANKLYQGHIHILYNDINKLCNDMMKEENIITLDIYANYFIYNDVCENELVIDINKTDMNFIISNKMAFSKNILYKKINSMYKKFIDDHTTSIQNLYINIELYNNNEGDTNFVEDIEFNVKVVFILPSDSEKTFTLHGENKCIHFN